MNAGLILIFVINSIECVEKPLGYVGAIGKKSYLIDITKTKQLLKNDASGYIFFLKLLLS